MFAADNAARMGNSLKDELAIAAGKVTPGVDDTPYIQYALEALTRDRRSNSTQHVTAPTSGRQPYLSDVPRRIPDEELAFLAVTQPQPVYDNTRQPSNVREPRAGPSLPTTAPVVAFATPASPSTSSLDEVPPASNQWIAVDRAALQTIDPRGRTYPPLTYKPRILRPFSMIILMISCLLMIAALIFSDRFSSQRNGLTPYPGTIYSGQYFVFRILPQLLAAVILIYAQSIVSASVRILPFTTTAKEDPRERYLALFQSLYPTSFLRPQLIGPWQLMVFDLATWAAIFTVPLQSVAFTCVFVGEKWIWTPSQGVVWALVGLYAFLLVATNLLMAFWFKQWTGLRWDMRSIADLIPLVNRTNTLISYKQRALSEPHHDFKGRLTDRWFDRLGYWQTEDALSGGIWHSIGTSAASPAYGPHIHDEQVKRESFDVSLGSHELNGFGMGGGSHLPWCLRDVPLIVFAVISWLILLALLVVSFLPQTRLEGGFSPRLTAKPDEAAFSPANFVYGFIPSLVGMILWLLFQSLDLSLRIVQPWGDMVKLEGAVARRSILADYAACLPLQATWKALSNGHWRVAVTSLMGVLFVFIPVLAGGLFMALTADDESVRMYPSMPVFGVLLAFLILYVVCILLLVPRRRQFMLPHSVTSPAGILALCSADELVQDAAFRAVRSHRDLEVRLGVGRDDPREESMWFFGLLPGRDEQGLSVRRLRRFTEKGTRLPRDAV
ncbi:Alcohol dehydrogenase superfamily, zinc-type [Purpureocillium lavendulum]|uniref:Alcohol dehydrogenase superfamily, zinc-type n=1 Tax=Purpureocillium lavendulum TaxID=1247861 RepID=A0AB34G5L9_9HYPO|nr:Alcohol dehydrogenase superfamily, zinc-type [Purpureocillium lavendulum]